MNDSGLFCCVAVLLQVLVYDVATETRLWSSQPGHTETIFDCCFAPAGGNPHLLATCSYDGTVRVWDVTTQCCVKTLETRVQGREPADTHTTEKGESLTNPFLRETGMTW